MAMEAMKDVLVVLPGLLGSVLQKDGRDVWAPSTGSFLKGLLTHGRHFDTLRLREDPFDRDVLGDGIEATRLMPDVHLIPGLWKIDGYSQLIDALHSTFDLRPTQNYFEFPYDWRRDVRVAARRLRRESHEWLRRWRVLSGRTDARLILIAHSLGGLVASAFMALEDGAADTRALVAFGTPFRGALTALDALANGVRRGPFGAIDLGGLTRSLTSLYQLLPVYPCYADGEGEPLLRVGETEGIPNVDLTRARKALVFHRELAAATEAYQTEATAARSRRAEVFPVVGIAQPTPQSARLAGDRVELLPAYEGEDLKGDGIVPRVSAMVEGPGRSSAIFTGTRHASLQNAEAVLTHLAGLLSGLDLDLGRFRAVAPRPAPARLALELCDLYASDEPVRVRVVPDRPGAVLGVEITEVDTGASVHSHLTADGGDGFWLEARGLRQGIHRLTVSGRERDHRPVEPVSDLFLVFDRD